MIFIVFFSFDAFFIIKNKISKKYRIKRERIGPKDNELRKFSKKFPSGYLFKDGNFFLSEFIINEQGEKIQVY